MRALRFDPTLTLPGLIGWIVIFRKEPQGPLDLLDVS